MDVVIQSTQRYGTRLFAELFTTINNYTDVNMFEKNVDFVFTKLINDLKKWFNDHSLFEFITENLLFTIIACFKEKDKYIVKLFGDGYIITQNLNNTLSYISLSYGMAPPYYAYKYTDVKHEYIEKYNFKTFTFNRNEFKKVGIATDGIRPIARENLNDFDAFLIHNENIELAKRFIIKHRALFNDDVTMGIF